jgi:hypothetical protein
MAALARRLGLGSLAGTVSGLAFALSGYLVARAGFLSINAAAAWLPWVLLGVAETTASVVTAPGFAAGKLANPPAETRSRFPLLLTFALAMQLLSGHAQTTWYTLLLAGFWAIFWGFRTTPKSPAEAVVSAETPVSAIPSGQTGARVDPRTSIATRENLREVVFRILRPLACLALAGLAAVALAAAQLFPTGEYLLHSQRESGLDLDFALDYSFSPWHFLTLALPDFFGNPGRGNYGGYANYWESAVYIGLLPFLLAAGAAFSSLRKKHASPANRPVLLFLSAVTLLSFLFALGKNTPLYPWLYRHVPTFDMFLGPARWALWAEFCLALLAGYGVQAWRRPHGRGLYWTRLGTAGALAATGGAILAGRFSGQVEPAQAAAVAVAGVWAACAGLLCLAAPNLAQDAPGYGPERHVRWGWLVILLVCADLLFTHVPLNPSTSLELYRSPSAGSAAVRERVAVRTNEFAANAFARIFLNSEVEYALKFERFFLFDRYTPANGEDWLPLRQVFLPNTAMLDGLPSANNFDPLVPARYARWMKTLGEAGPAIVSRLLPRMGVRLVERVDPSQPGGVSFTEVEGQDRARWVPCAQRVPGSEAAWQEITSADSPADFARTTVVLEEAGGGPGPSRPCDPAKLAQVHITAESPNRLDLELESPSEGWLVIADTWYPGWTAQVDGKPAPILRADFLFRAIAVPPGIHRVRMQYRPFPFYAGLLISLAAWVSLGFASRRK